MCSVFPLAVKSWELPPVLRMALLPASPLTRSESDSTLNSECKQRRCPCSFRLCSDGCCYWREKSFEEFLQHISSLSPCLLFVLSVVVICWLMHSLTNSAFFFRVFEETIPIEHLELFDEYVPFKTFRFNMNLFILVKIVMCRWNTLLHAQILTLFYLPAPKCYRRHKLQKGEWQWRRIRVLAEICNTVIRITQMSSLKWKRR